MALKKGFKQLVAEAEQEIESLTPEEVDRRSGTDGVVLVDLRDIRELQREGQIPGAKHIPRGMLEFWVDPESPYHKDFLTDARQVIFYCSAGWRSALATKTVQDMGMDNVSHMAGGFTQWVRDIGRVKSVDKK